IAERGVAARAPVDHVLAAIDESFLVKPHEDFADGAREALIEREAFAGPIAARPKPDHLPLNGVAGFGLPLPNALFEFFTPKIAAVQALFGEFALHHHLGSDPGVIGSRQPQRIVAAHAVPADGDIDFGVLQHVTDVKHAGHIGGRNDEREYAAAGLGRGAENAGINPPLRPMWFEPLRFVHFLNLHGNYQYSNAAIRPG